MSPVAFFDTLSAAEIVPIGAAIMIVAFTIVVWFSVIERDPMRDRVKAMSAHREHLRQRHIKKQSDASKPSFRERKSLFSSFASEMRRAKGETTEKVRLSLAQAGWRSNEALGIFFAAKMLGPFAMFGLSFVAYYMFESLQDMQPALRTASMGIAVLCGFIIPDVVVSRMARRRGIKLERGLPDALDLMVVCTEAGLGMDSAFDRVSNEVGRSHPEVADELSLTSVELNILPNRTEALNNLVGRTGVSTIESVVSTLAQTERYGTPVSQSFRVLAADFREARLLRAEEKAARLPATLTIPMVLFILPCLFAVLLGPAIINSLDTF